MSKNNMFKFITEYNSNIGYICNNFIDFLNKNKINFFNFILDNEGLKKILEKIVGKILLVKYKLRKVTSCCL